MADFIFIRKSRNILSSFLHVVFNLLLAIGSILITVITGSWILGIILVALSKWRVLAVRPRYWLANIKSSLVDLIVGGSIVLITYCSGTEIMPIHYALGVIYAIWLVIIKPRSTTTATELQSLIAVFFGTTAVVLMTASADAIFMVVACYIIGYGAARHVMIQSDEQDFALATRICGLVAAEVAWICHGWLIVYKFGNTGVILPQLSIILTILAFCFGRVYQSILKHDGKLRFSEVAMPIFFSILVVAIIVIGFSKPIFDI
ncbi:hypothetical protein IJG73_03015 [Candidatus Saccharibacteria bacterium]|nr:hypothetical protein [Candidatus Saccharibacteria bacterium]